MTQAALVWIQHSYLRACHATFVLAVHEWADNQTQSPFLIPLRTTKPFSSFQHK